MFSQYFLKAIVQIMFHSICSLVIQIYCGNKIVVTPHSMLPHLHIIYNDIILLNVLTEI